MAMPCHEPDLKEPAGHLHGKSPFLLCTAPAPLRSAIHPNPAALAAAATPLCPLQPQLGQAASRSPAPPPSAPSPAAAAAAAAAGPVAGAPPQAAGGGLRAALARMLNPSGGIKVRCQWCIWQAWAHGGSRGQGEKWAAQLTRQRATRSSACAPLPLSCCFACSPQLGRVLIICPARSWSAGQGPWHISWQIQLRKQYSCAATLLTGQDPSPLLPLLLPG